MSAPVTQLRTAAETALIERFGAKASSLPGGGDVARRRNEAFGVFEQTGLPGRRIEEFHYTDLRTLVRTAPEPAQRPTPEAAAAALAALPALANAPTRPSIDFVNGYLVALPAPVAGVRVVALAEALAAGDPLTARIGELAVARDNAMLALNTAFMAEGVIIHVSAAAQDAALMLRFANAGAGAFSSSPRVLVVVDDDASFSLLELNAGAAGDAYQVNSAIEFYAGDRSTVSHVRLNAEGDAAQAISTLTAQVGGEANFSSLGVVIGASLSRHQIFLGCAGENSEISLGGVTMLRGQQFADTTLTLDHAVPGCNSRELFKTALDDAATAVFQGKIIVRQHAQKTDGRMMSAALLLSENATMNNKPELEIFADDVQCAHGATCGQLDDDLLFYLMARGLPRKQAEALMLEAFLGEPLEHAGAEDVREMLEGVIQTWLAQRG